MNNKIKGGIYHKVQIDLTYNSTGSVKGWLETSPTDETKYILYVASTGTTYLYNSYNLFFE